MAKATPTPRTSEQAAEPACDEIIPDVVKLESLEINEKGQLVIKTGYLHQNAERPRKKVREPGERRKRWRADLAEAVAKELWPPDGKPPETMFTPEAVQLLGDELDRRNIKVPSRDTRNRPAVAGHFAHSANPANPAN